MWGRGMSLRRKWTGFVRCGGMSALGSASGPTVATGSASIGPGAHVCSSCTPFLFGVHPLLPLLLCVPSNRT